MLVALRLAAAALASACALLAFHAAYAAWLRRRFPPGGPLAPWGDGALRGVRRGAGEPVVLVHGSNGTAHDFPDALVEALARDHAVAALDRPGHAGSATGGAPPDLAADARATLAVLDALGGGPGVLVGHSYGAAVVLRAALERPECVAGVLLVAPCTVLDARHRGQARLPLPHGALLKLVLNLAAVPVVGLVGLGARRLAWHPDPPPRGFTRSRAWGLDPAQLEAALANARALPAGLAALERDLPRLSVPLAILAAEDDRITPWRQHAAWLQRAVPGARLDVLPRCGHWLPRQRPDAVAAAVRALTAPRGR